jgi:hypothetical protein
MTFNRKAAVRPPCAWLRNDAASMLHCECMQCEISGWQRQQVNTSLPARPCLGQQVLAATPTSHETSFLLSALLSASPSLAESTHGIKSFVSGQ